jgi:carbonic anhydrase
MNSRMLLLTSFLGASALFGSPDPFGFFPLFSSKTEKSPWLSPEGSLTRLMEGNKRYVEDLHEGPDRTSMRRLEIYQKQRPFAIVLGCSDSRVPPEIVFDQGLGDLFVVRVAGQVAGPVELDSIEYAAKYLGASLILVLGHQSCGAVNAVLKGKTAEIEDVADLIKPAIQSVRPKTLENSIKANVRWVVEHLKNTPMIEQMMKDGKIDVVGGYYTLPDGKVEILGPAEKSWARYDG